MSKFHSSHLVKYSYPPRPLRGLPTNLDLHHSGLNTRFSILDRSDSSGAYSVSTKVVICNRIRANPSFLSLSDDCHRASFVSLSQFIIMVQLSHLSAGNEFVVHHRSVMRSFFGRPTVCCPFCRMAITISHFANSCRRRMHSQDERTPTHDQNVSPNASRRSMAQSAQSTLRDQSTIIFGQHLAFDSVKSVFYRG